MYSKSVTQAPKGCNPCARCDYRLGLKRHPLEHVKQSPWQGAHGRAERSTYWRRSATRLSGVSGRGFAPRASVGRPSPRGASVLSTYRSVGLRSEEFSSKRIFLETSVCAALCRLPSVKPTVQTAASEKRAPSHFRGAATGRNPGSDDPRIEEWRPSESMMSPSCPIRLFETTTSCSALSSLTRTA